MQQYKVELIPSNTDKYNFSVEVYYTNAVSYREALKNVMFRETSVKSIVSRELGILQVTQVKSTSQDIIKDFLNIHYSDVYSHELRNTIVD